MAQFDSHQAHKFNTLVATMKQAQQKEHKSLFDERDIKRIVGSQFFERGLRYYERGKVLSVDLKKNFTIRGEVMGNQSKPYVANISVNFRKDRSLVSVSGICSCPVGFNCKHVAAILIAANKKSVNWFGVNKATLSNLISPDIRDWLDSFPGNSDVVNAKKESTETTNTPQLGANHLFYVIDHGFPTGMCITPYNAYLKKDGTIGRNYKRLSVFDSIAGRSYATLQDASIFGKLTYYGDVSYRYYRDEMRFNWPEGEELTSLLKEIVDTGRVRLFDVTGFALSWSPQRNCELRWEVDEFGEQQLEARDDKGTDLILLRFPTLLFVDLDTQEIGIANTQVPSHLASWLAEAPPVPQKAVEAVSLELSQVDKQTPLPKFLTVKEHTDVKAEPVVFLYSIEMKFRDYYYYKVADVSTLKFPCVRLEIAYAGTDKRIRPNEFGESFDSDDTRKVFIKRNRTQEQSLLKTFFQVVEQYPSALTHDLDYYEDYYGLKHDADIVLPPIGELEKHKQFKPIDSCIDFASTVVPELKSKGWRVEIDKTWPYNIYEGSIEYSTSVVSSDSDWFSLALSITAGDATLDVTSLVAQIIKGLPLNEFGLLAEDFDINQHLTGLSIPVQLEDGAWVMLEASQFAQFAKAFLETQGLYGFHRAEAARLSELVSALEGCGAPWAGGDEIRALGAKLQSLTNSKKIRVPTKLKGKLRPYQRIGYGWLKALSDTDYGGVLADDMGLGKTVQTLALLAYRHLQKKSKRPSLLIVPTSLIGNWRREAARFVPDLKVLVLHGPHRQKQFDEIPDNNLVITTYPLVNRDHKELFDHEYDVAVLDEAQAVKNPAANVTKLIREIRAQQRIALTGTPIENNLQELWSLYDWLIPGLLGNRKNFNRDYRNPIEKKGDYSKQRLLSMRVKPFLLRRTKEQVAIELPKKTVIDDFVLLEGEQAKLYESIRVAMDNRVREIIAEKGLAASRIQILDALLKLRQVCCDPRLVKLDAAKGVKQSSKLNRLVVLLEELVAEERKVLVFSQFVTMLRLVEKEVKNKGWSYSMLHGSTKNRDEQIDKFQNEDIPLFLISLKAGGLGLNLTAADTVIIYDPWWNPAVERQAMDRAHRIGQDKPVFVHRLVAENTVEATIQKMQQRKQSLADALFEGTGKGPTALTEEDIATLFSTG